jgi:hypothetical protein
MKVYLLSLQIISSIAEEITIPTTFDFGFLRRFQTTFFLNNNISLPAFASLALGRNHDLFQVYGDDEDYQIPHNDLVRVNSWVPREPGSFNISTLLEIDLDAPAEYNPTGVIAGSARSRFGRAVGSYIVTPVTPETGQLIIRPTDPRNFAYNREIFYATCRIQNFGHRRATIPVAIRIIPAEVFAISDDGAGVVDVPAPANSFTNCFIETQSRYILVPRATYQGFIAELDRLGVYHETSNDYLVLRNVTEAVIDSLPILQYLVLSDEGFQVSIQVVHPRDYVLSDESEDSGNRKVLLNEGSPACDIPSSVTNKMMIHMDLSNGRVGFGEPLNEI